MTVKLLIADDHPQVRDGLTLLLAHAGIDVVEAATCKQARKMSLDPELDAVLLDINMPDGNGLDVLAHIKSERPELPVLIHSDCDRRGYKSRSLALGASAYLVKGLDKSQLLESLHSVLNGDGVWNETHQQQSTTHDTLGGAIPSPGG